jgi:hypothetical protein
VSILYDLAWQGVEVSGAEEDLLIYADIYAGSALFDISFNSSFVIPGLDPGIHR